MAKATHNTLWPVSGDSFTIAEFNNAFNALHQGDIFPFRPRAHGTPDMGIMVGGALVESFYSQCYASGDFPLTSPSGDVSFSAPASNPRIDIVYTSGDRYFTISGTEAASPAIPRLPSGDGVIPISCVYHKTTETKIVNYEDKDANPNEGYIYRDIRPIINKISQNKILPDGARLATSAAPTLATQIANKQYVDDQVATANTVYQEVYTQTGAVATGTTTIPLDDTIPENTEGTEFMTRAITPNNSNNILKIEALAVVSHTAAAAQTVMALFQDSTVNALAATVKYVVGDVTTILVLTHHMTAGTTSATTFKIRIGASSAATVTFNGVGGARYFGGVIPSSITITEFVT